MCTLVNSWPMTSQNGRPDESWSSRRWPSKGLLALLYGRNLWPKPSVLSSLSAMMGPPCSIGNNLLLNISLRRIKVDIQHPNNTGRTPVQCRPHMTQHCAIGDVLTGFGISLRLRPCRALHNCRWCYTILCVDNLLLYVQYGLTFFPALTVLLCKGTMQ